MGAGGEALRITWLVGVLVTDPCFERKVNLVVKHDTAFIYSLCSFNAIEGMAFGARFGDSVQVVAWPVSVDFLAFGWCLRRLAGRRCALAGFSPTTHIFVRRFNQGLERQRDRAFSS